MDQDFFKGIEASSMSVDEILREFHAQQEEASARDEPPRRAPQRPPERPAEKPRPQSAAEVPPRAREKAPKREPPAARGPGPAEKRSRPAFSLPWQPRRTASAPPQARRTENRSRGKSAETESYMDQKPEKEQSSRAQQEEEILAALGSLFSNEENGNALLEADDPPLSAESAPLLEEPAPYTRPYEEELETELSLEDIINEYSRIFEEKPPEPEEEPAEEATQFFIPQREKSARPQHSGISAGAAAVSASATGRGGSVSSMADEALRYINSLSDEELDRMAETPAPAAPAPKKAPAPGRYDHRNDDLSMFNLGGEQKKMVFGGKELDLSADESYVPTAQKGEPIYHWTEGEEDLPEMPVQEQGLLQRILRFNGVGGKLGKKPLNAPVKRAAERPPEPAPDAEIDETAAEAQEPAEAPVKAERPKKAAPDLSAFSLQFADEEAEPAAYAPEKEYASETEAFSFEAEAPAGTEEENASAPTAEPAEEEAEAPRASRRPTEEAAEPEIEFPSFRQYLASLLTGTLYRMRGVTDSGSATMDTDGEDLGPEVTPAAASRHYASFVHSLRLRFHITLGLLLILAWISLGLPVAGMLRTIRVAAGMCLLLQLTIMLLSLDVVTGAAINLARGRFGADSLAVLCCVLTSLDALAVALRGFGSPHMPLCFLSSLSLAGVLLSSLLSARGLRKTLRVPSIAKRCSCVTGENDLKGKGITLLKVDRPPAGFVRRCEEAAPDETAFVRAAPVLLLLCLLLAALVAGIRHAGSNFLYIFTALLVPATPLTALLCFALPFFVGSNRIFYSGAAVAGWSGLCDIGRSQNLIITDRDLFPEGSVELDTVRIFADADAEKILSYAGTMILASGSGIAPCFSELMTRNGGSMRQVENFEMLPGGGMKGIIAGETVLCGSLELMRLMNVRVPFRLVDKTTVLLAIDGVLYGIFNMKYTAQPQVRKALIGLIRSSRHPVFAIRDFNVNPEMLHQIFGVATDGYDFPPYLERFALSEPPAGSDSPVAAVICREGLGPLSHMADTGRSMYLATRFNLVITLLAALFGVFAVFIRFMNVGAVGCGFLLLIMLLWVIPVTAISLYLKF